MHRRIPIVYSALMLTAVNLLLRAGGTAFQVFLSGRIGPEGIGLLQLVLSVGSLVSITAMGGIRTTTMYLAAEEFGRRSPENIGSILSGCFRYSLACSGMVCLLLHFSVSSIAELWIGTPEVAGALRLYAFFLPAMCLCGVLTGYFTGANRIGILTGVEVAEQILCIGATIWLLIRWAGHSAPLSCIAVIAGSGIGCIFTLMCLTFLRIKEGNKSQAAKIPVKRRILEAALPLAGADILKSGISTIENLMVPKRLGENISIASPLGAFGLVSGMVFPVMMFPACILFGFTELLIPELARSNAAGSEKRIRHLVSKSLQMAVLYGFLIAGGIYLGAETIGLGLYQNPEVVTQLRRYSLLIPMLYCDIITDALTKGLGQQRICVQYNIFTTGLDVVFLYFLLPIWGMDGYYISFIISHGVNFLLSLSRLKKISGVGVYGKIPAMAAGICGCSMMLVRFTAGSIPGMVLYCILCLTGYYLTGLVKKEDFPRRRFLSGCGPLRG